MRILKKVRLILAGFALGVKILASKVYAYNASLTTEALYGIDGNAIREEPIKTNIASTIIVPIILLIGVIAFLVKSKGSLFKKAVVSMGVVMSYIVFRIIINLI